MLTKIDPIFNHYSIPAVGTRDIIGVLVGSRIQLQVKRPIYYWLGEISIETALSIAVEDVYAESNKKSLQ